MLPRRATTARLAGFEDSLRQQEEARLSGSEGVEVGSAAQLVTAALDVGLPGGRSIVAGANLQLQPGQRLLISGPSGSGKSTLLRVFAGIWPFARGRVERPLDAMFIPQRPYFPDGSLRAALAYPEPAERYSDEQLKQALRDAQLPQLQEQLDSQSAWNSSLSGGRTAALVGRTGLAQAPGLGLCR